MHGRSRGQRAGIEQEFDDTEREAAARRRIALTQVEDRFRQADASSATARRAAEDQTRSEYEADVAAILSGASEPGQQVLARADAARRLSQNLDAARAAYLKSLDSNKNTQQDELRAATVKEIADVGSARDHARIMRARAQQVYERELKAAETRLRTALHGVPGADDICVEGGRSGSEQRRYGNRPREFANRFLIRAIVPDLRHHYSGNAKT